MIPKHIFREYDIRGLADTELTDEASRLIGKAFGTELARPAAQAAGAGQGKRPKTPPNKALPRTQTVGVGCDLRPSSERIRRGLIEGLLATGARVLDLGLIPTPLLYFAIVHFGIDAGVSITGSHNPPEYNGFKFQLADRPFYGADIRRLAEWIGRQTRRPAEEETGTGGEKKKGRKREGEGEGRGEEGGKGKVETVDVIQPYLAQLKKQFRYSRKRKIVIDSGHAMSALVAPKLFRELGQEVVELYTNLDPTFPDHHPDPSVPKNLEDLAREVKRTNASIGIAFDGDADRIGVVDELGSILPCDRLLLIYARQVLGKNNGATIVGDVKCSPLLYEDIARQGGRPILWKTGHSLIKAKMKEAKALLGGELSGHMFFADRWYGFDDAIYAACRILEILDEEKRPLSELSCDLPRMFSTPEIRLECTDDGKKFEIVRKVVGDLKRDWGRFRGENRPRIIDLDGARIEFPDGWGLIRASNTQPVLVMRFEATSEKRLAEIRSLIEGKIKKYGG